MGLFKAPIASLPNTNAALLNGKIESQLDVANADTLDNKHYSDLQNEFATIDHLHIGLTPAPTNTQATFLRDDNTWATPTGGSNLELGETETTAYRGDRGKTAYDHSQVAHAPSTAITSTGVTYENLSANGDVGTGADQVANGAHTHDIYAAFASGVTNGNTHDHSGGDGAQISYTTLGDVPTSFVPSTHTHVSSDLTDGASTFATHDHLHAGYSETSHVHGLATDSSAGFMPALTNYQTSFLRDDGTWQEAMSNPSGMGVYARTASGLWQQTNSVITVKSASYTTPPDYPENGDKYLLLSDTNYGAWEYYSAGTIVEYVESTTSWKLWGAP